MNKVVNGCAGTVISVFLLATLSIFTATQASAATAAECRANWNSMKAGGSTPAGVKYNQYIHDCVSGTAATIPGQAPAGKVIPVPSVPAKDAGAGVTPTSMPTATPTGACTVQYDLALLMGKIPTGQSKDLFLENCMAKSASTPAATQATIPVVPVPPEPTATGTSAGGQAGEVSRIRACG